MRKHLRERMEFLVRFSFITIDFLLIRKRLQCGLKQCTIFLRNIEKSDFHDCAKNKNLVMLSNSTNITYFVTYGIPQLITFS